MRRAFINALSAIAAREPRVVLLTGDLGYTALEPFADAYPTRFFNVGVAEQNMVGIATGLAEAGLIPFVYSIVPFAVLRPFEFIRNGPIQHQFPVRIVGVGAGFDYGLNGLSHYGLEDVAVLRSQPGITILAPADFEQARSALEATWDLPGPIYYRLSKDDTTVVPGLAGRFELGRLEELLPGHQALLLATGSVASEAVAAARLLAQAGVSVCVQLASTLAPVVPQQWAALLRRFPLILTVEAHYATGGLGSLVAEVIAENALPCRLLRAGVRERVDGRGGSTRHLLGKHGLTADALASRVRTELEARHA